jgi:hypothetical protein
VGYSQGVKLIKLLPLFILASFQWRCEGYSAAIFWTGPAARTAPSTPSPNRAKLLVNSATSLAAASS